MNNPKSVRSIVLGGVAVIAAFALHGATGNSIVIDAKTLDGTETFAVTEGTVVSNLTVAAASEVSVAEGVTLTVDKIIGSSVLTKSGAGELALGAGCPTGNVVIAQGKLSVSGSVVPVPLPAVAANAILHLDASDRDSIVMADTLLFGRQQVAQWKDTRGGSYPTATKLIRNGAQSPYINEDCWTGMPVMDFTTTEQWSGPAMQFSTTLSVREAFFVVNDNTKTMPYINYDPSDGGLWQRNQWADSKIRGGLIECDDAVIAYNTRLPAGFHVVHYRLTGNLSAWSIASQNNTFGGMQFGEMILFSSVLSDNDVAAMKEYLARKWQPSARLGTLTAAAGTSVAVAGVRGLSVDALKTSSAFEAAVGAEPAEMALATIHLDASVESSFTYAGTTTDDGQRRISKWSDVRGENYKSAGPVDTTTYSGAKMPFVNTTAKAGTQVVDFGKDCSLTFSENISVTNAFFVVEETGKLPYINLDTWSTYWKAWDAGPWQRNEWCNGNLAAGIVTVDGVSSTYANYRATNGFHVVRITPNAKLTVNSIARQATSYGQMKIAEMVLFDCALSEDAVNRLTTYLTTKWNSTSAWGQKQRDGVSVAVSDGSLMKAKTVSGAFVVSKSGEGDLLVGKTTSTPAMAAKANDGTLSFTGVGEEVAVPSVVTSKAVLHLDASDADSIVFADGTTSGMRNVAQWKDARGGSYPTASKSTISTNAKNPYLNESCYSDRAVMDFTTTEQWTGPAMQFSTTLSVREAFFVVNDSTKIMPYVNNDAAGSNGDWQRNQWANGNIRGGLIECDDTAIAYNSRLSGGFHVVHYRLKENCNAGSIASQNNTYGGMQIGEMILFSDARSDADAMTIKSYLARKWQRCDVKSLSFAEGAAVAVADNVLVNVVGVEAPTSGKIVLGDGSKVVLPVNTSIGAISSAGGTVSGDVALKDGFVFEVTDLAKNLTVDGTLTLPSAGTFKIVCPVELTSKQATYVLATATSLSAADASGWQVNASTRRYDYRVYVKDNQLLMDVTKRGLLLIVK